MAKICGKLEMMSNWRADKARAIFDEIVIDGVLHKGMWVANQTLAGEIHTTYENLPAGGRACLYYFGHMLRKRIIIGLKPEGAPLVAMVRKGLVGGFVWYFVFGPIIYSLGGALVGGVIGMVGGKGGSAFGIMLGLLYGVGGCWFTYFRMYKAYHEMQREAAAG